MNVLKDHRSAIYQTAASIFGSLLGFVIAALSLVIGFSGSPSLKLVRESSHYPTLWKTFAAANRALGLATVMSFLALIFDRDHCPSRLIFFAVVYAALLAALRVGRSVWILEQVVRLVAGKNPTSWWTRSDNECAACIISTPAMEWVSAFGFTSFTTSILLTENSDHQ
jgi:hypothetical protein